jgi:hypothetical protein
MIMLIYAWRQLTAAERAAIPPFVGSGAPGVRSRCSGESPSTGPRLGDDERMAEKHTPAEPKKIHGDKLAEALLPSAEDEDDAAHGDARLLSRHPAAKKSHVVRR